MAGDIHAAKATIYYQSEFGGLSSREVSNLEIRVKPYAQYQNAVHVVYVPRGKRKRVGFVQGYKPSLVVLDGWGHPAPSSFAVESSSPGVTVARSKFLSFSPEWDTYFDGWLKQYLASSGAKVLGDYRGHQAGMSSGARREGHGRY